MVWLIYFLILPPFQIYPFYQGIRVVLVSGIMKGATVFTKKLYYDVVVEETTGAMKKSLLAQLPHDHALVEPLRKALIVELKNLLPLQL